VAAGGTDHIHLGSIAPEDSDSEQAQPFPLASLIAERNNADNWVRFDGLRFNAATGRRVVRAAVTSLRTIAYEIAPVPVVASINCWYMRGACLSTIEVPP